MKELSSTKPSDVKRFALISNYLPLQARVGSPTSPPRLIVPVGAISERCTEYSPHQEKREHGGDQDTERGPWVQEPGLVLCDL